MNEERPIMSPAFRVASIAVLAAVTTVLTRVVQIPTTASNYINLGDVAIVFTAIVFGPFSAALAGGLGTALADLLSGPYAFWAPISLVVHGLQGLVVGLIVRARPINVAPGRCRGRRGDRHHGRRLLCRRRIHHGIRSVADRGPPQLPPGRRRGRARTAGGRDGVPGVSARAAVEMVGTLAAACAEVRQRIEAAARRAGRQPSEVRLMAVTKGFPRETVQAALSAGLTLFGENRVQEAEEKFVELAGLCEIHLIGHLQRNKARTAAAIFSCVQSIDKAETAEALDARCAERGPSWTCSWS